MTAPRRPPDDFKNELDAHLALERDALVEEGVDVAQAAAAARRALGNRTRVEERYYERQGWRLVDEIRQDVGLALRILGRNKRFAAAVVATMALGVGANTALTGAIDEILWSPLNLPRAEEIVAIHRADRQSGRYLSTSYLDFQDLQRRVTSLSGVAGYLRAPRQLDFDDQRVEVGCELVTANYFDVLEVRPILGRAFRPEEELIGTEPVAVLSETLWSNRFGRDAGIIGRSIRVEGELVEVIGVVSANYGRSHNLGWNTPPELWLPIGAVGQFSQGGKGEWLLRRRTIDLLELIGRLSRNASLQQAQAEVETILASLAATGKERPLIRAEVLPAARSKFYPGHRRSYTRQLALVGLVGALVLLLACSNIANLLLERTSRRRQELAVRSSLGAGRARLIRQLLTEAVVLAVPGFFASMLTAYALLQLLKAYPAALGVPLLPDLQLTWRVVVLCLLTTVGAVAAFSVVPVLAATRVNLASAASARDPFVAASRKSRVTHALVAAQVAMSTVLLVGALLMTRGIAKAYDANLRFQTSRLMSLELAYSSGTRTLTERPPDQVLDATRWNVPGIVAVAMASGSPFWAVYSSGQVKDSAAPASEPVETYGIWVTSGFFDVMDIPLLEGRSFSQTDAANEPTVVVSRAVADRLWKGRSAIGRFIEGAQMDKPARVVGVAGDARYVSVWESRPMVYHRVDVNDHLANTVLLRTAVPPSTLLQNVGRAWRAMSPDLRVSTIRSGEDYVRRATDSQRLASRLVGVFSLIALAVASIGLYSAMAWIVERRRREIAIRMAVGGSPGTIASRVVLQAGVVAIGGTSLGLGVAAALAPQLAAMSRHTTTYDPVAFGGSAAALVLVCLVAAMIPAVRASRVDPAVVLRGE